MNNSFNSALIISGAIAMLSDYDLTFRIGLLLLVSGIILQFFPIIKKLFKKIYGK